MRFRSKPLVALSILLTLAGAMGGWHAPDDRDGETTVVVHHHGNHDERVTAAAPAVAPEHCTFCHWLRTFGSGAPVAVQILSAASPSLISRSAFLEHVQASDRLILPSRAPPLG